MKNYLRFLFLSLIFAIPVSADVIVTTNGTIYNGTIRSATDSTIVMTDGGMFIVLNKSLVLAITFSSADVLYLTGGGEIMGKVAAKEGNEVVIATAAGVQRVPAGSVEKVKYNLRGEVKVTELPATSSHFVNADLSSFKENASGVFLLLQYSNHYAALTDWKNQFTGGTVPTQGIVLGLEGGYILNRHLSLSVGYEGFTTTTIEVRATTPTFDDYAAYTFLYSSIQAGLRPASTPEAFIYGALDLGSLTGKEGIKNMNGMDFEASGSMLAYRIKGGLRYMTGNRFSLTTELGYLNANLTEVKLLGTKIQNYSLDFSGVTLRVGLAFHFSITKG
jgi:hypothetical protein